MRCRSLERRKLMYSVFVGDGDSSSFKSVVQAEPYGAIFVIKKYDCIGHVQKRMGTALRTLVKGNKGTVLVEGSRKGVSGKGRLTKALIDKFQNYYGMAIRNHLGSKDDMCQAVQAIVNHYCCPVGEDSWCKFAGGDPAYEPKPFTPELLDIIKPTFDRLSADAILDQVQRGGTQNRNESIHAQIWRRSPKHVFASAAALKVSVGLSVLQRNVGNVAWHHLVLREMGIFDNSVSHDMSSKTDDVKIADISRHTDPANKIRRKKLRQLKKKAQETARETKGKESYMSGAFDNPTGDPSDVVGPSSPRPARKRKSKKQQNNDHSEAPPSKRPATKNINITEETWI